MRSIYEQALGDKFKLLHTRIQERFGFSSEDGVACIGRGTMDKIWHGAFYTLPFLYLGSWRRIMFPEHGTSVPFTIRNYAYVDEYGRETVTWIRNFLTSNSRRFDAYMIFSQQRQRIVDYLGTHQHLAVDIELSVDQRGGLRLSSGAQRFYEAWVGFDFPMLFSGVASVCEWYDDSDRKFHIEVAVRNQIWGPLFGYRGSFDVEWLPVKRGEIPADVLPARCERRE
ncbi:MAG TPA: DUF4166 domain-containing protein [Terriglobales bacterium]|nr:DUF4166 domain-containing protein [Terriglobales bacterium]